MVDFPRDVIDTLIAEAYAEGPEGMRRVAETIINRAAIRGLTPEQVVRQAHQYTGYEHPGSDAKRAQQSNKARTAAEAAWDLALQPGDPTGGADHYLNPNQANPSWASKLPSTGSYGNHKFFASRPIPPGEIANVVGTLTDTVPPVAPMPVTSSPDLQQMRRSTAPTSLIADSFASLPKGGANLGDRIGINPVQGGRQTAPPFDAAFDTRVGAMRMLSQPEAVSSQGLGVGASPAPVELPRPRPSMPLTALTAGGRQPIGMVEPGNLDLNSRRVLTDGVGGYRTENSISIGTDRGEVLIPTVVNGKQLSEPDAIEHYQRTGENLGTFQTPQAADRYAETLHERQGQRYGNFLPAPVPQSNIERGKSTAPSGPRPRPATAPPDLINTSMQRIASANPTRLPPVRTSAPQSQIERNTRAAAPDVPARLPRITVSTPYTTPQSSIERGAPRAVQAASVQARPPIPQSFAGMEGGYRPPTPPGEERLAASNPLPPALYGGVAGVVSPPSPYPRLSRAGTYAPPLNAVATELDTVPMPDMPRRPQLAPVGDMAPAIPQAGQVAPMPMPRLERGGIFGKPQIFGHDIRLPGALGVLQNVTKAMNNASGPFNNGADNLLYNTLRGGDFNTPGAATAQSAGYQYAKLPSGGWLNVGRVNPAQSGADLYSSRNASNNRPSNAYERMKANAGTESGQGSMVTW